MLQFLLPVMYFKVFCFLQPLVLAALTCEEKEKCLHRGHGEVKSRVLIPWICLKSCFKAQRTRQEWYTGGSGAL